MEKKNKKLKIKENIEEKTRAIQDSTAMWNPFEVIENMNRFFWDDPWMPLWWRRWQQLQPWTSTSSVQENSKPAPIDLIDNGDHYKIIADMPGISKKDLDVQLTPTTISICGKTKTEFDEKNKGYLRRERRYSTLCRNMVLPEEINPDQAEATLTEGVLEIHLPKKSLRSAGKKIPVK